MPESRREKYIATRTKMACRYGFNDRKLLLRKVREAENETDDQFNRRHRIKEE
jgi:hypothetical protein